MPIPSRLWTGLAFAAWLAAAAAGFALLERYKGSAGARGAVGPDWPAGSAVGRADADLHLVLFAHPRCPCTRATLTELARVLARGEGRLRADVLFYRPGGPDGWAETDLFRAADAIPGVRASWDEGGREASRFGARTSGHALVYDRPGRLRFSGGLTASRGHQGANAGSDAVVALVLGHGGAKSAPVFGCPLETPCDSCPEESE